MLKVYTDNLTELLDPGNSMDEDEKKQPSETTPRGQNGEKTGDYEGMSHQNADDYAMEEDTATDDFKKRTALDERELLHTCKHIKFTQDVKLQTILDILNIVMRSTTQVRENLHR